MAQSMLFIMAACVQRVNMDTAQRHRQSVLLMTAKLTHVIPIGLS
jgi:hypothetical protein